MMMSADYVQLFGETVAKKWGRPLSPTVLSDTWGSFIAQCQMGYSEYLEEYDNDLSIRNLIAVLLEDEHLSSFSEFGWFEEAVEAHDRRFAEVIAEGPLVRPDRSAWWERRIPPFGGEEFVRDAMQIFGTSISIVGK